MISCGQRILEQAEIIFEHSGKFIQRLGQFRSCLQNPKMIYNLVWLARNTAPDVRLAYIGLCLPKECTKLQVETGVKLLLKKIPKIPLVCSQVVNQFSDQYPYTWVFYLTVFLLLFLTIMLLIATWTNARSKQSPILASFNMRQTLEIFTYKPDSNLNVFNGVRSLAMVWVVLSHAYSFGLGNTTNTINIQMQTLTWFFLFVEAGIFAVDTFFFVGGFLVAYSVLRIQPKSNLAYPLAILHRILRFWPAYLMTILIYYSVFIHTNSGPFWDQNPPQIQFCSKMWKPLFFVDNLVDNGGTMCLGWGWYLQNDMQIFIFCMILLVVVKYQKKLGLVLIYFSILGSLLFTFVKAQINSYTQITHMDDFLTWNTYFSDVYIKPWGRCAPYLYGLVLGISYVNFLNFQKRKLEQDKCFMSRFKQFLVRHKLIRFFGVQLTGIVIMLTVILLPRSLQVYGSNYWPQFVHSFYISCAKIIFVFGLTLMILPSLLGINSFVAFCMNTSFFNFIAKISFCTYLLHLMVLQWVFTGRTHDYYYTPSSITVIFCFCLIVSLTLGFWLTVLVEIPFSKLQKKLFEIIKPGQQNLVKEGNSIKEMERSLLSSESLPNSESVPLNINRE